MTTVKIVYNPNKTYQPKARIVHKLPEVKQPSPKGTLKIPKYVELP